MFASPPSTSMMDHPQPLVYLSVVLPCANERENLQPLIQELETELQRLGEPFEIIVVDDASTDGGVEVLSLLQTTRPWLRILRHRINYGQSACYCTGFQVARGDLVVTMDGDRQHDPADLPRLLGALQGEVAAVCGVRTTRHDNWVRRMSSRVANQFATLMTGDAVVDAGCTFRVIRKSALAELPVFNGLHRFLPTLLSYQGYQVVRVPVRHRQRLAGKSKYGIGNRLWRGMVDCLAIRWFRYRCIRADRLLSNQSGPSATSNPMAWHVVPEPPVEPLREMVSGELKR